MKNKPVDILLATHNGASFIEELVASIMAQRCSAFRILVRDDGSTDETPKILNRLSRLHPQRIHIVQVSNQARGPIFSYSQLLKHTDADYVMFCDQDDVWLDFKIEKSMDRMQHLETAHGKHVPILVHTDLKVVDEKLSPINDSFATCHRLNPQCVELNRLLVKNVVTGCTMTINRSLKQLIGGIPLDARMHDWWIALVASLFGVIGFIEEPTILYRQHHLNAVGARPVNLKTVLHWMHNVSLLKMDFHHTLNQTKCLLTRYGNRMGEDDRRRCHAFLLLSQGTVPARIRNALENRFLSHGILRNLGLFLLISGSVGQIPGRVDIDL